MALNGNIFVIFKILKNDNCFKLFMPFLSCYRQFSVSPHIYYSKRMSIAMKIYMENYKKYNDFIAEQAEKFETGKKHLANMMGKNHKTMTQEEIDEAIRYLLPSALYVPKSRPQMKPPSETFKKSKAVQFDYSGRPFHFLFYTGKAKYSTLLHDAATHLKNLNAMQSKDNLSGKASFLKPLSLASGEWLDKAELESIFDEPLYTIEYEKYLEVFQSLIEHPYAELVKDFIMAYRKTIKPREQDHTVTPTVTDTGTIIATEACATRNTSKAVVTLRYPGTGVLTINGRELDYFENMQSREEILFPLLFTDMLGKVDIQATVEGGGPCSQAGAIRYGISRVLQSIVSQEMALKMKLAGLLQRDIRRRERNKPGQAGARKKYTWLKR